MSKKISIWFSIFMIGTILFVGALSVRSVGKEVPPLVIALDEAAHAIIQEWTAGVAVTPAPVTGWNAAWANFLKNMPGGYYTTQAEELRRDLSSAVPPFLLDVRETSELEKYGFIKGAVHLPFHTVLHNLDELPAFDQPIVVYSGFGHRGAMVMCALRMLGYTKVSVLDGGMSSWYAARLPVVHGTPAEPAAGKAPVVDPVRLRDLDQLLASDIYGITAADLRTELASKTKPFLLDVRNPDEVSASGAIEGSIFIPVKTLFDHLDQLPADKTSPMVVICSNGDRSTIVMMALRMNGYTNVRSLFGGLSAWTGQNGD